MKKNRIVAAVLCASVALSTAAFAQGGPDQQHGGEHGQQGPQGQQGQPGQQMHGGQPGHGPQGGPSAANHGGDHHDNSHPPMQAQGGPHGPGPGDGPDHGEWRKGDRVPRDYRDRQYVVDDWRGYGLRQPPRGYQWVGVGGDYLLVAAASGIIAQIVLAR